MATGRPGRRHMRIGELERALGVTRDQVHHYVELGLVPAPEKSAATLAWYGPEHQAAVARVRAIRDAGGSLSQAQRWLSGPLAQAGLEDCATLTRWVIGDRGGGAPEAGRARAPLPLEAVVAMIDAGLARVDPDALVSGAAHDPTEWLEQLAARWVEREEQARVTVAGEALEAAASAKLAPWLPIEAARVEGGAMRAAALDGALSGAGEGAHEERARLGVMVPLPTERLPEQGGWSAVARGVAALRSRRWVEAGTALSQAQPGAAGSTLAAALGWCAAAMAVARAGDGALGVVGRLGALRSIDASAVGDLVERLRLRWTLAVTWLALPARWGADRPGLELEALMAELATVPSDDRRRATGELDVVEANAGLALSAWRLRAGDRAGSAEAARGVLAFGGEAAREAARRVRRASRAM